jgi:hypothetical protein
MIPPLDSNEKYTRSINKISKSSDDGARGLYKKWIE